MNRQITLVLLLVMCATATAIAQDRPERRKVKPRTEQQSRRTIVSIGGGSVLGVRLREIDEAEQKRLNLAKQGGALITEVEEESAAAEAGLKADDVVVGFDGETVRSVSHLQRLVKETPPGRTVEIDVMRGGHRTTLQATMRERKGIPDVGVFQFEDLKLDSAFAGRMKVLQYRLDSLGRVLEDSLPRYFRGADSALARSGDAIAFAFARRGRIGVELQPLTPQLARYFGVSGEKGALITAVADTSAAERAGLEAGDVIVAIDGKEVNGPGDVMRLTRDKEEGEVDVKIVRDRKERIIRLNLPKREARQERGSFHFEGCFPFGMMDMNENSIFRYFGPDDLPPTVPLPPSIDIEEDSDLEFSATPALPAPRTTTVL